MLYKLKNIQQRYSGKLVLDIPSLEICSQKITAIKGANGSGKSTLLRLLGFLESPSSGTVILSESISAKDITMLLAEPYLLKRSVRENLLYGAKNRGVFVSENELHSVLDSVGLLPKKFLKRYSFELSSGEAQRIALASRLIFKPKVLILDEPTKSLDIAGIEYFTSAILDACKKDGIKIIVCDHNIEWLKMLTDEFISLNNGKVSEYGYQNIITTEWEPKDGLFQTHLGDGNSIFSEMLPQKYSYAYIPPEKIKASKSGAHGQNSLFGKIESIRFLEEKCEIKIIIGRQTLVCYCELNEYQELTSKRKLFLNFGYGDVLFV